MKKITLLAVAFVAISFASCKKERSCQCTTTNVSSAGSGNTTTTTNTINYKKIKKGDLKDQCTNSSFNTSHTETNGNTTTTDTNTSTEKCEIK